MRDEPLDGAYLSSLRSAFRRDERSAVSGGSSLIALEASEDLGAVFGDEDGVLGVRSK